MSARRTERLLNLVLALLTTRRGLSRAELRRAVPGYRACASDVAFERMFERDKDDLRELGIPVTSLALRGYGEEDADAYRVDAADYALPDLRLTAAESTVLALAATVWRDAALAGPAARALVKLQALGVSADPEAVAAAAPQLTITERAFTPLHEAVRDRQPVSFGYRRADGSRAIRQLEPWRLLLRRSRWYVVGHDRDRDEPRVFRLGRVVGEVRPLGAPGEVREPDEAAIAESARLLGDEPGAAPAAGLTAEPRGGLATGFAAEPGGGPGTGPAAETEAGRARVATAAVLVRTGRGGRLRARAMRAWLLLGDSPPPAAASDSPSPAGFEALLIPLLDPAELAKDVAALAGDVLVRGPASLVERLRHDWAVVRDRHSGDAALPALRPMPPTDLAAAGRLAFAAHPADGVAAPSADRAADGAAAAGPPRARDEGATARLSRLLALVPYVLARGEVGLADTARHFGVSERQLVKDLQLLFVCGTPGHLPDDLIEADWEDGRVHIANAEAISRPPRLTGEEATALRLGLRLLADVPGGHDRAALTSAASKLAAVGDPPAAVALLEADRAADLTGDRAAGRSGERAGDSAGERAGERVGDRAAGRSAQRAGERAAGPAGDRASSDAAAADAAVPSDAAGLAEAARTVVAALDEGRRVRLCYLSAGRDELTEREVDPWRLVAVGPSHYLEAWCHRAGAVRRFRLDRVLRADILPLPTERVADTPSQRAHDAASPAFSPATGLTAGQGHRVLLRLGPAAAWLVDYYPGRELVAVDPADPADLADHAGTSRDTDPGGSYLELVVPDLERAARLVLAHGGDVEAVAPAALRELVRSRAARALIDVD